MKTLRKLTQLLKSFKNPLLLFPGGNIDIKLKLLLMNIFFDYAKFNLR